MTTLRRQTTIRPQAGTLPAPATFHQHARTDRPHPAPQEGHSVQPGRSGNQSHSRQFSSPSKLSDRRRSHTPVFNRVRVLMVHAPRYGFQGQARLAADAGVSRSTISRLISGRINPSFRLAQAVTAALEKHLKTQMKRPLCLREVFSPDGAYPTPSGCALAGCRGCMPEEAYDAEGSLKPAYRDLRPGDWSLARPSQEQPIRSQQTTPKHTNTGKESR